MNKRQKQYTGLSVIKILDEEKMILDHCISDELEDRDGDIVLLNSWDFGNYLRNPIVLESHDAWKLPVGKCVELYVAGNQLRAKTQFAPTERGKELFALYKNGFMHAFSVQFIAKTYERNTSGQGGIIVQQAELLEYSCVTIPANPRALKMSGAQAGDAFRRMLAKMAAVIQEEQDAIEDPDEPDAPEGEPNPPIEPTDEPDEPTDPPADRRADDEPEPAEPDQPDEENEEPGLMQMMYEALKNKQNQEV